MNCPEDNELIDFLDGHHAGARAAKMEAHFDACEECRVLVGELGRTLKASSIAHPSADDWKVLSGGELVSTGDQVGRYIIVKCIGAGAMGVVYQAYDPELDRSIALKLVRVLSTGDEPAEQARQRLLREAKAMAKLSDRNVVTIFDASGFGDWVYLAMELVDGIDLRSWLEKEPRDWRAIVTVFSCAARGLWAAHEAGIVHRDFKPANVLIDKREDVRVADFGLATMPKSQAPIATAAAPVAAAATGSLTVTGTLMGTPAYMSPEVRDGASATALSDQYSFGVSLSDAFKEAAVPKGVLSIVDRATQVNPELRFSSMSEVADALDSQLRGNRRIVFAIAAAILVLGLGVVTVFGLGRGEDTEPPCRDAEAQLAGVWDETTRAKVQRAFANSTDLNTELAFAALASSFDSYAGKWKASYTDSCEATHVSHQQSQVLSDRRMQCLKSELDRFRGISLAFHEPSASMIRDAAKYASFENNLHYCNDIEALLREKPIPRPEDAERVATLTKELRAIEALAATASTDDYLGRLETLALDASKLGYRRLQAEVLNQLGHTLWQKGDQSAGLESFEKAVVAAEDARSPDIKIKAMTGMVALVGDRMGRHDEGLRIAQFAEAALAASPNPSLMGEFLNSRAGIFFRKGDNKQAERDFRKAYDILLEENGAKYYRLSGLLGNIAIVVSRDPNRREEALVFYERALTFTRENKGVKHPEVAQFLANRSGIYAMEGRQEERLSDLREALEIRKASLDDAHPQTLDTYRNLGNAQRKLGANAKALKTLREGAERARLALPTDDITHANFADDIGRALLQSDKTEEAIQSLEAAIKGWEMAAKTRSRNMTERLNQGASHYVLAQALWSSKPKRASVLAMRALALLGDDFPVQAKEIERWLDSVR